MCVQPSSASGKMALKGAFNLTQIRALLWKDVLVRLRQPVSYLESINWHSYWLLMEVNSLGFHHLFLISQLFSVEVTLLFHHPMVHFFFQLLTIVQNVWVILIFISLYTVRSKFQPVEVDKCKSNVYHQLPLLLHHVKQQLIKVDHLQANSPPDNCRPKVNSCRSSSPTFAPSKTSAWGLTRAFRRFPNSRMHRE